MGRNTAKSLHNFYFTRVLACFAMCTDPARVACTTILLALAGRVATLLASAELPAHEARALPGWAGPPPSR